MYLLLCYFSGLLALIIVFSLSIWIFKKLSKKNLIDRLWVSSIPLLVFVLINVVLINLLQLPFDHWNHSRLTPAFALVHGYQFFNALESSPLITWMSGPLASIVYLPATLANSPTVALRIAGLLTILFFFFPIFWFSVREPNPFKKPKNLLLSLTIFTSSFLFAAQSSSLSPSAFRVHADGPSLGLAGAACGVICYKNSKNRIFPLVLSSILAVLSIWTKHNLLPLPIALLSYIFITEGYQNFKRYLLCFLISGALISGIFIYFWDAKYLYFTLIKLPSNWPWRFLADDFWIQNVNFYRHALVTSSFTLNTLDEKITLLSQAGYELTQISLPLIFIIIIYTCLKSILENNKFLGLRKWLSCNRWSLLLLVSLYMAPIALVTRAKQGGALNSHAITVYFLLLAVTAIAVEAGLAVIANRGCVFEKITKISLFAPALLLTIMFLIYFPNYIYFISSNIFSIPQPINVSKNPVELAYNYAKEHPNQVYFPEIPLATLMAEGKLYHSLDGLRDREIAGLKVSNEDFQEYIPLKLEIIAFYNTTPEQLTQVIMKRLPDFSKITEIRELPGFLSFTREE